MANRCDYYSDEEFELAQQLEYDEYLEDLAREEAYKQYCYEEYLKSLEKK